MIATSSPARWAATPTWTVTVVFPTPPFSLKIATVLIVNARVVDNVTTCVVTKHSTLQRERLTTGQTARRTGAGCGLAEVNSWRRARSRTGMVRMGQRGGSESRAHCQGAKRVKDYKRSMPIRPE